MFVKTFNPDKNEFQLTSDLFPDINECSNDDLNDCGSNTVCEDKLPPTKYECHCNPGYKPKDGSNTECEGTCHP